MFERDGCWGPLLDTIAIDKRNIDVMIDDGFHDVGEICAGRYQKPCQEAGLE